MQLTRLLPCVLCLTGCLLFAGPGRADDTVLSRIGFGACAKQDQPQPIWEAVVAARPERFVMIGDNIYGDTRDMAVLKAKWDLLGNQPGYQKLKATCPVIATWDDHDFGENDAGVEYPHKKESSLSGTIMTSARTMPESNTHRRKNRNSCSSTSTASRPMTRAALAKESTAPRSTARSASGSR